MNEKSAETPKSQSADAEADGGKAYAANVSAGEPAPTEQEATAKAKKDGSAVAFNIGGSPLVVGIIVVSIIIVVAVIVWLILFYQ